MSEPTKRWWNCWLAHSWGRWERVVYSVRRIAYGIPFEPPYDAPYEDRRCLLCGKLQSVRA